MTITTDTAAVLSGAPSAAATRQRRVALLRDVGIGILPVILFLVLTFTTDSFFTADNLRNVLNGAVALGLIACAGTVVIIAGGFDLSAAAIFAVAGVSAALVSNETSAPVGILVGLVVGCGLGLINGVLVSVGRVNQFVGTLGTMIAYAGLATALSGSGLIIIADPAFASSANTTILGLRSASWVLIIFAVVCAVLLNLTVFGRHAYATGGNASAARLSGVSVNRTLIVAYVLSGGAAALAAVLTAGTSLSVSATSGSGLIFDALAAILIGGNSILGGRGAIWRTIVGVLTLALISNGFNLLGVDPNYQQMVSGIIILVAVAVDAWTRRRTS
ncbi:ABC transporter permease [Microbacterium sp. A8/3-1]|uniref:ABC transporter permease n=1 Tax=Microbacterium sp. A8/3-1 TaxID=3160749 RepID=A0AAU7VXU0_9MICO